MKAINAGLLLWLYSFGAAAADTLKPYNFMYTMPLVTPGNHPVYQLPLPKEVYRGIQARDAGDLRIFNADGTIVPYALRKPQTKRYTKIKTVSLPVFPIVRKPGRRAGDLTLFFHRNNRGTLAWINSSKHERTGNHNAAMYVIDASRLRRPARLLQIDWSNNDQAQVFDIIVEYSNDLKTWRHAGRDSLARLSHKGHRLVRNRLYLPGYKAKYFRLRWPEGQPAIHIVSVNAQVVNHYQSTNTKRYWHEVKMRRVQPPVAAQQQKAYVYFKADLGTLAPVDTLQLQLPDDNMALSATVLFPRSAWSLIRNHKKIEQQTKLEQLWQGSLYRIRSARLTLSNRDIKFRPTVTRQLYLRVPSDQLPPGLSTLTVKASWIAQHLLFIAQGRKPYTLAYGSPQIQHAKFDFDSLNKLIESVHGKKLVPGTASYQAAVRNTKYKPVAKKPAQTDTGRKRNWLLWTILASAVLLLGLMAYGVSKQLGSMQKDDKQADDRSE